MSIRPNILHDIVGGARLCETAARDRNRDTGRDKDRGRDTDGDRGTDRGRGGDRHRHGQRQGQ